jgi:hypothetical protein
MDMHLRTNILRASRRVYPQRNPALLIQPAIELPGLSPR